jgi:hypothetical protein
MNIENLSQNYPNFRSQVAAGFIACCKILVFGRILNKASGRCPVKTCPINEKFPGHNQINPQQQ